MLAEPLGRDHPKHFEGKKVNDINEPWAPKTMKNQGLAT